MRTDNIALAPLAPGASLSLTVQRFGPEDARPRIYIQASLHADEIPGMIAAHQAPDGLGPNADLFATLEALHATGLETARTAVGRALPALADRQRVDGTFGAMAQQERALIALRAFRWAGAEP